MLPVLRNTSAFAPITAGPMPWFESLFDRFLGHDGSFVGREQSLMPVAFWEDDDHYYVEADLPGVAEADVDVSVHNGTLFLRGVRKPAEGRRYLYNGRPFGRFEWALTLPAGVDTDRVTARLADGVLALTLPKSPEAKPKTIALQTN
jgi:HSP20 family protein